MPEANVQFLQTQINELQIRHATTERIVIESVVKVGENNAAIKAMHARFDLVATRDDFQEMLDRSRDKAVADLAKKIAFAILTLGLGALASWISGVWHPTPPA